MSRSAGQIALATLGVAATGAVAYAVYFDYMRRSSASFRRSLRKQHDKVHAAAQSRENEAKARNQRLLRAALAKIQSEPMPVSPAEQEQHFQEQVALGEQLAVQGPDQYVEAASHFYRALRVYPQPVELLMIYQKVVPPAVFGLIIELSKLSDPAATPLGALGGIPGLGGVGGGAGARGGRPAAAARVDEIDEEVIAAAPAAPAAADDADDEEDAEEEEEGEASPKADSANSGASWERVEGGLEVRRRRGRWVLNNADH